MSSRPRAVARVIEPQPVVEGAGVRLIRSIARPSLDYLDPFLLLDHFESDDPRDYLAGFPLHPHRGIETVTYMLAGEVDHKDTHRQRRHHRPRRRAVDDRRRRHHARGDAAAARRQDGRLPALGEHAGRAQDVAAALPGRGRGRHPGGAARDGARIRVVAGQVDGVRGRSPRSTPTPSTSTSNCRRRRLRAAGAARPHRLRLRVSRRGQFGVGRDLGYRGDLDGQLVAAPRLVVFEDGDEVRVQAARLAGALPARLGRRWASRSPATARS